MYSFEVPWFAESLKRIKWSPSREKSFNEAYILRIEPVNETNVKAVIYIAVIPISLLEAGLKTDSGKFLISPIFTVWSVNNCYNLGNPCLTVTLNVYSGLSIPSVIFTVTVWGLL